MMGARASSYQYPVSRCTACLADTSVMDQHIRGHSQLRIAATLAYMPVTAPNSPQIVQQPVRAGQTLHQTIELN